MGERFSRLYQLDRDQYTNGAPVVIAAGALLKDTATGSIIVQLKLQNISEKSIVAAKVWLCAYDVSGKELHRIDEYQYLDIDIRPGAYWGGDKAIILPDPVTRSFSIEKIEIIFSDNGIWDSGDNGNFAGVPMSPKLGDTLHDPALVDQYRIEIDRQSDYVPSDYGVLWRCACGNLNQGEKCTQCGIDKAKVFGAYNVSELTEKANVRIAKEQAQAAENAIQKRKKKKLHITVAVVAAILVATVVFVTQWLVPNVIKPSSNYKEACALVSKGEFDAAISIFSDLGNYNDSDAKIIETRYLMAESFIQAGEYNAAIRIFDDLGAYGDAAERANELRYQMASDLEHAEDYASAIKLFSELGIYKDAETRIETIRNTVYDSCMKLVDCGDYAAAYTIFAQRDVFTEAMAEAAINQFEAKANDLFSAGQSQEAEKLSEVFNLSAEQTYCEAVNLLSNNDYDGAFNLLSTFPYYKNASVLLHAMDNRVDGVYSDGNGYFMCVRTVILPESGDYWYKAWRWFDNGMTAFNAGTLLQVSDPGEEVIMEYANEYRWTISDDKSQITADELYGSWSTLEGGIRETVVWSLLDEQIGEAELRKAQAKNIV